jgi:hypothetical protein
VSPIEAESQNEDNDKDKADANNVFHSIAVVHVHNTDFNVVFNVPGVEDLMTDSWSVRETSTDGVENGLGFQLASVGGIVDHN